MNTKIILASTSIYRKALLEKLQLPFECVSPKTNETPLKDETAQQLVLRLAQLKAQAGVELFNQTSCQQAHIPAVIIGSDQVAVINGQIIGKPLNKQNAVKQLKQASGQSITFYTGLSVIHNVTQQAYSIVEPFTVHFKKLTTAEIERYVDLEQPLYCAGSFKSEGLGIALFERLEGDDPNTLIGLPLIRLIELLKRHNINVL
ncbi:Maf family protein [Pseudomonadota bacterium]|uniref:Maf family protein n=1 Tax=unclassified Shewanella TaxID=196818 RepID=UPI000C824D49|nr:MULTISPECIES: nucleoside triphosphate pyrophosphatase [unclassified Shewanella]MDO6774242.1 nucleoside triphosphate pyrophosphatase [Shewanella sp. 3_MG-2023]PMG26422.1 septum formation protein Maf [Shewanella sp. 10N.286.52.C2]PMH84819.1 septum formation protein Maf [Shewanella sp. 10N.286.48.B5]PMI00455.1 septum formation protein Maf [Shewanella sp. 10N.286.48.A6]